MRAFHYAPLAFIILLGGCFGGPKPDLHIAPPACPPALTADVPDPPKFRPQSGFPQPANQPERDAVSFYLEDLTGLGRDDREKTARLREGQKWCAGLKP